MAYPPHVRVVRSLSPITELTTPASARSIPLPEENVYDYMDESPIHPHAPGRRVHQEEEKEDDGDSVHSQESNRTVVPSSSEPSPLPPSDSSSPLPSPPSTIREFQSTTTGLPPPPRPTHSKGDSDSQPTTPRSSALQLDARAIRELKTFQDTEYDSPDEENHDRDHDDDDEMDRASVSTVGMAGIGSVIYGDAAKQKKHRPKSLHNSSHVSCITHTSETSQADDLLGTTLAYHLGANQSSRLTHSYTQHPLSPVYSAGPRFRIGYQDQSERFTTIIETAEPEIATFDIEETAILASGFEID